MRYPWLLALAAIPLAAHSLPARAQSGSSTAAKGQITLYELPAFLGSSVKITGATPDLATQNFAKRAQSAKVKGEWQVCDDAQYEGNCTMLSANQPYLARSTVASVRPSSEVGAATGSSSASGVTADLANMDVGDPVEGQDVAFFSRPTLDGTQVSMTSNPQNGGEVYCRLAGFTSATYVGRSRTQTANVIDLATGKRVRAYALRDLLCKR